MLEFLKWKHKDEPYPIMMLDPPPPKYYDVVIYFRDGSTQELECVRMPYAVNDGFLEFINEETIWGFNENCVRSVCLKKKHSNKEEN